MEYICIHTHIHTYIHTYISPGVRELELLRKRGGGEVGITKNRVEAPETESCWHSRSCGEVRKRPGQVARELADLRPIVPRLLRECTVSSQLVSKGLF